uniref:Methyltransferase domain-containing protein n=1 Tax=Candidatus Kentrum sp. FW TaxID=2126338 RepID=A0A450RT04_9GAMM|nr:MAG: Methyltransferase domain-containing protein [Candidatus Kentron sp. FW]
MKQSDLFQEKAEGWDADDKHRRLASAVSDAILRQVSFHERMHVMDFGAGTGLVSAAIAPLVGKITALDTSEAMLEQLVAKPELRGKVEAVCQDITRNITDNPLGIKFDRIVSAMTMHHVQDTHQLIYTFAEHAKPGAVIALADLDKEDGTFHPAGTQGVFHHGFDRDGFRAILEEHGFGDVRFVTAHSIPREGKDYPVFLCVATKQRDQENSA